jgi:hypothetical protein
MSGTLDGSGPSDGGRSRPSSQTPSTAAKASAMTP